MKVTLTIEHDDPRAIWHWMRQAVEHMELGDVMRDPPRQIKLIDHRKVEGMIITEQTK